MDVDMEVSPSYSDPEDLSIREQFRRYGKRNSASSISPHQDASTSKYMFDGHNIPTRPNAALFLDEIKQEVESIESDGIYGTTSKFKRRSSVDDGGFELIRRAGSPSSKSCKTEDEAAVDGVESTFTLFASLLDSRLHGLMSTPDLILQFERECRNVSESLRYGSNGRHRVVEDKLMRQKARLLLDEAASWSLLWYLFGKGNTSLAFKISIS